MRALLGICCDGWENRRLSSQQQYCLRIEIVPAGPCAERGVPPAIVPLFMIAGRLLEIVAGFGLALGLFPRWCALALFAFLLPATFVSHSFWLAASTPQFQGQLINFSKNVAIWGGLIFIAGTSIQPSLLPRR